MCKEGIEFIPKRYDWLVPKSSSYARWQLDDGPYQVKSVTTYDKLEIPNQDPNQKHIVVKIGGNNNWWALQYFNLIWRFKKIK